MGGLPEIETVPVSAPLLTVSVYCWVADPPLLSEATIVIV